MLRKRSWLALFLCVPLANAQSASDPEEQYRFLVGLIEKEMFELAAEEGLSFLREHDDHPKAPLARYRLATALFELERFEDARPHYERLSQRGSFEYRGEAWFRLGQCELARGRHKEAERALRSVLDQGESYLHDAASFLLAESAFDQARYEEADRTYAALVAKGTGSEYATDALRGRVWCAWQLNRVEDTVERAEDYLRTVPEGEARAEIAVILGEAHLESGAPQAALSAYRSVKSGPFADAALRGEGFALAALEEHDRAAEAFGRLAQNFPDSEHAPEAKLQAGIQLFLSGDAAAAKRVLQGMSSNDPEALYWLARAQREEGQPEEALRSVERALAGQPEGELAERLHVARGDLLSALGQVDSALDAYESGGSDYALYAAAVAGLNEGDAENAQRLAAKLIAEHDQSPYLASAYLVLGESLFQGESYDRAHTALERCLALDPKPEEKARALTRQGWCRYLTGNLAAAIEDFGKAVEESPAPEEAEEALSMLARSLQESGQGDRAREARRLYLSRYPQGSRHAEMLFAEAQAAEGLKAVDPVEQLTREHPGHPLVARALALLADRQSQAGELSAARRSYEQVLAASPEPDVAGEARYGLAWCSFQQEDYEGAAALLTQLSREDLDAELERSVLELAVWSCARAGQARQATEHWRRFARVGSSDEERLASARLVVEAWKETGDREAPQAVLDELLAMIQDRKVAVDVLIEGSYLALDQGDVDRAEAQVRVARRQGNSPAVAEAAFFVGEARFEEGSLERAADLYEAAAKEESPVQPQALYKLGFAHLRGDDAAGARSSFARLVEGFPESELWGEGLFLLGESSYRVGDYPAAIEALERLRERLPRHEVLPKALFRLGLAYGELERWREAEARLAALAQEHPDFSHRAEAELWRGKALEGLGRERPAAQAFERVLSLDKGELACKATLGLGRLAETRGDIQEALSTYLKVSVLYGYDEPVAQALLGAGRCLERLEDPEKAAEQYREILERHPKSKAAEEARRRLRSLGSDS